jgi:hypothetical protein
MDYYQKYLKYKNKYLELKKTQIGGVELHELRSKFPLLNKELGTNRGNPIVISIGELHLTIFADEALRGEGHITHTASSGRIYLRYNKGPEITRVNNLVLTPGGYTTNDGVVLNATHLQELYGAFSILYG